MVLLALIVTRSSVTSLQAREGLPVGNQVVGWFVLGGYFPCFVCCLLELIIVSGLALFAFLPPLLPEQQLSPPPHGHLPDLFANIHHSHHLVGRLILLRVLHDPCDMGPS